MAVMKLNGTNGDASGHARLGEKRRIEVEVPNKSSSTKRSKLLERTDFGRWRLQDDEGRQTWHYLDEDQMKEWPQSVADRYFLGLPLVRRSFQTQFRC